MSKLSCEHSCDKCGLCCRNLNLNEIYSPLHDGTGVCRYLNEDNLCLIYHDRPLLCNIERSYEIIFKYKYSLEEYYNINKKACNLLKNLIFKRS